MAGRVAVIGAGALGLSATKNFIEDGFKVTTYESRDHVGGLWKDSHDSSISVHSTTIFNNSKFRAALSDFPFAESDDDYPTAAQLHGWLERYARHFGLLPSIKLGTKVLGITRESGQWSMGIGDSEMQHWRDDDRVFRQDQFKGKVIHSIDYHQSEDFKDQNVLLVGMHATGQDVTNSLSESAKHVYLAHRSGLLLLPRYSDDGATFDQTGNLTFTFFMAFMFRNFPIIWSWILNKALNLMSTKAFPNIPKEWGLRPAPHIAVSTPLMADTLWQHLQSKFAEPVPIIRRIIGLRSVELQSGRILEDVDSIIYCTGYNFNIPDSLTPKTSATESIHPYPGISQNEPPNLYRNIFPLHQDESIRNSLAFLGQGGILFPGFVQFELSSMSVSQVWRGKSQLPPYTEMLDWRKRNVAERQAKLNQYKPHEDSTYYPIVVNTGDHLQWIDEAAGTGLYRNLGLAWFNWRAWKLWWQDKELYNLCMKGLFTPLIWRLFETGKRKALPREECRAMIVRQNELAKEQKKRKLELKKCN